MSTRAILTKKDLGRPNSVPFQTHKRQYYDSAQFPLTAGSNRKG